MHPTVRLLLVLVVTHPLMTLAPTPALGAEPPSCPECLECAQSVLTELDERGWLGMALHMHSRDREGLEIQFLEESGPAAAIGLREGDRVLEFQGVSLTDVSSQKVQALLHGIVPGERVVLRVLQDGERRELTLRAQPMTLRAKALALGSYFIRAAALAREHRSDDHGHPPM